MIQKVAPVCITDWSIGKSNDCFLLFNDVSATKTAYFCWWMSEWICSSGGMILKRENRIYRSETCHIVYLDTKNPKQYNQKFWSFFCFLSRMSLLSISVQNPGTLPSWRSRYKKMSTSQGFHYGIWLWLLLLLLFHFQGRLLISNLGNTIF